MVKHKVTKTHAQEDIHRYKERVTQTHTEKHTNTFKTDTNSKTKKFSLRFKIIETNKDFHFFMNIISIVDQYI